MAAATGDAVATQEELAALRAEVKALRDELTRTVGAPPLPDTNAERTRLETALNDEQKKLAAIQAAVESGLDSSVVAASITQSEARIAELEAALAKQPKAGLATPSLFEVANKVERIDATLGQSAADATRPVAVADVPGAAHEQAEKVALLPLEFTAFGDFYYVFSRPNADDFHVGAVEIDAALSLTPYVNVSTAIAYAGDDESFGLGAFVIDCGLAGDGEEFLLESKLVQKSGISFGQFDVPFGIAYLEYPSVENRLVTLPRAVELTHGAWNDLGVQGYAIGEHWTAVAYLVNGQEYPLDAERLAPARTALGGRASGKVDELFEVGGSIAANLGARGNAITFAGADVTGLVGPLDVRGEYLLEHVRVEGLPELTHGVYARALARIEPAFLMARYDMVLEDSSTLDRRVGVGGGYEVFPQGEVRAVYEQSLDTDSRTVTLQLVGGSSFQPTGLRR
jgi:hypothetical protein